MHIILSIYFLYFIQLYIINDFKGYICHKQRSLTQPFFFITSRVDELKQFGKCTDITLELGTQDLSNVKKNNLEGLASYALECYVSCHTNHLAMYTPIYGADFYVHLS